MVALATPDAVLLWELARGNPGCYIRGYGDQIARLNGEGLGEIRREGGGGRDLFLLETTTRHTHQYIICLHAKD